MKDERYWVSVDGGEAQGPYWPGKLRQMAESGLLKAEDQICADGTREWASVSDILEHLEWKKSMQLSVMPPLVRAPEIQWYPKHVTRTQTNSAGVILIIVGLLFAVCWIGIPFFIWGCCIVSTQIYCCGKCGNEVARSSGCCPTCGAVLLAPGQRMRVIRPPKIKRVRTKEQWQMEITLWILGVLVLGIGAFTSWRWLVQRQP